MRALGEASARALALALLAATATACIDDAEPILTEPHAGPLFQRYVSLGNSITAGFQSGGLHVQFQREAYPALLAEKAGASFGVPGIPMPGCPVPFVGPLTTQRIGDVLGDCIRRRVYPPPPLVNNYAVPGADVADLSDPEGTGTLLETLLVGQRSQLDAMRAAQPTLVSIWIGNNDALGAALGGDTTALTPLAEFRSEYDEIVAAVRATDARDAILIGVADAAAVVPALQPGAYFWALAQSPPPGLPAISVSDNCAPFTPGGQPNRTGFNLVSFVGLAGQLAAGADPIVVDCADDAPFVLNSVERDAIGTRNAAFNDHIEEHARTNGWIYVDPNAALIAPALSDPDVIRKCQHLGSATDQASFFAAVVSSCPVDLDPATVETFFGSYFSFDGVHPSSMGHAVIADTLAKRLNDKHGLDLP